MVIPNEPVSPAQPPNDSALLVRAFLQGLLWMLCVAALMFATGALAGLLCPDKDVYQNRLVNSVNIGTCFVAWGFYYWILPIFGFVGFARGLSEDERDT